MASNPIRSHKVSSIRFIVKESQGWCSRRGSNPHAHLKATDFKSDASADSATGAWSPREELNLLPQLYKNRALTDELLGESQG